MTVDYTVDYQATKTASIFHKSNQFVRLLLGPVGCGKSVANCIEIFRRALQQEACSDGIRRSRWGIVRNTYPELKSTTIKTWTDWFPEKEFGKVKLDSPITHTIRLRNFELEVVFLALDNESDISKLMSFEFTGLYLNELQYIHPKIFEKCFERVGRYPAKKTGARITWTGVIADTNPPPTRHWIYETFEKNLPSNFEIFKYQPALIEVDSVDPGAVKSKGGKCYKVNPAADYIEVQQLEEGYYLNQVPGKDDEEIKVSILGEYGIIISGQPVHKEYKDAIHYPNKELTYNPNLELGFGWDFGLTPALVIVQFTAKGQLVVLDELYSEHSGLDGFVENTVLPHLNRKYPQWRTQSNNSGDWIKNYVSRHDPAGQQGAQTDEKTCQQILAKHGIYSLPAASSNAPTARREGLKYHLNRLTNGEPGFLLSNTCQVIREGLRGHFQYAKIQAGGSITRYHEKPLKNLHSHPCEALEYIGMYYANPVEKEENEEVALKAVINSYSRMTRLRNNLYGEN